MNSVSPPGTDSKQSLQDTSFQNKNTVITFFVEAVVIVVSDLGVTGMFMELCLFFLVQEA